jgi:hypothetical protein
MQAIHSQCYGNAETPSHFFTNTNSWTAQSSFPSHLISVIATGSTHNSSVQTANSTLSCHPTSGGSIAAARRLCPSTAPQRQHMPLIDAYIASKNEGNGAEVDMGGVLLARLGMHKKRSRDLPKRITPSAANSRYRTSSQRNRRHVKKIWSPKSKFAEKLLLQRPQQERPRNSIYVEACQ